MSDITTYMTALQEQGIVLDTDDRRQVIQEQAQALAEDVGGNVLRDAGLLDEITNLVEAPTALLGSFSEESLELPREVSHYHHARQAALLCCRRRR